MERRHQNNEQVNAQPYPLVLCFFVVACITLGSCDSIDTSYSPPSALPATIIEDTIHVDETAGPSPTIAKETLSIYMAPKFCCNPRSMLFGAELRPSSSLQEAVYYWEFGDGRGGNGAHVEHTYAWPGKYLVQLRAQLQTGEVITAEKAIYFASDIAPDDGIVPDTEIPGDDGAPTSETDLDPVADSDDNIVEDPGNESTDDIDWESIGKVLSGEVLTANALWWGFDANDSTYAIQSAINSGAKKVVVPYVAVPWTVGPIWLASNQELVLEPGVIIAAKKGQFHGLNDCLMRGQKVSNVLISGYGATLRMRREDYLSAGYSVSEFRHALAFYTSKNVTVLGVTMENSGGDGIHIGPADGEFSTACEDVLLRDCVSSFNHRQGMSLISGRRVQIINCEFRNTKGTAPQAGLDLEPGGPKQSLVDIDIVNCRSEDNEGSAYVVNVMRLDEESEPVSVRFRNCAGGGGKHPGIRVMVHESRVPRGQIEFVSCTIGRTEYSGLYCAWNPSGDLRVRFDGCRWERVATLRHQPPMGINLVGILPEAGLGAIEFTNSVVFDDYEREALMLYGIGTTVDSYGVIGELDVVNDKWVHEPLDSVLDKTELRLRYFSSDPGP